MIHPPCTDRKRSETEGVPAIIPPLPLNEPKRLETLRRYGLLDTPQEAAYDRMTRLAARLLGTPVSLVSLLDESRQWFKSRHGFDTPWTGRDLAFCSYTILQDDVMVVADALQDERFARNALVTDDPGIRFYAGVPLRTTGDLALGSLCVIDHVPRHDFGDEEKAILRDLAAMVMHEIEARHAADVAAREIEERRKAERALAGALEEKETLLREIHHRVKNNLQSLWGLLQIEKSKLADGHARERMDAVSQRISVMGSIHQQLYTSPNLARIDLATHVEELCRGLMDLHGRHDRVRILIEADPLECTLDTAIPLGLIANEVISNSLKHAFPGDRDGTVRVRLRRLSDAAHPGGLTELLLADDGVGMPRAAGGEDQGGIGMILIRALAAQIDAGVSIEQDPGVAIRIRFAE